MPRRQSKYITQVIVRILQYVKYLSYILRTIDKHMFSVKIDIISDR